MAFLGDKSVGDVVKIKENGVAVNYIIIHKGKPSTMYDNSCDGIWLLRQEAHSLRAFNNPVWNDYEKSDIRVWLNSDFLNTIDSKIRSVIKVVKIPYKNGLGSDETTEVHSGVLGLLCRVFLLSACEVGVADTSNCPVDGVQFQYFNSTSRIAKNSSGTAVIWWLRSPSTNAGGGAWCVDTSGSGSPQNTTFTNIAVRPAFVLSPSLVVSTDDVVSTNTLPTISSDKTGDLGTLTEGFVCNYSVDDEDAADVVSVTLSMDDTAIKTFTATKGTQYTYSLTGNDWLKITNGTHTFKITATDGKDAVTSAATFTRACRKATITLKSALPADDIIRFCSLKVKGALPMDTILKCEVTNNANDSAPVWEDCTARVKSESTYIFKNKVAENGFAFNFRISAERGASGIGGYVEKILGGFE